MVTTFWNEIGEWETNEVKNESRSMILASARAGARMEAYVKLFHKLVGIE